MKGREIKRRAAINSCFSRFTPIKVKTPTSWPRELKFRNSGTVEEAIREKFLRQVRCEIRG